jgi:glycosyltransferase involved in cell wall biosynthesis
VPPTRAEFIELERHCAARPDDRDARRRLLQLFVALGQPADLPGSSRALPASGRSLRIAALTPYYREPLEVLERCHRSVRAQTVRCEQILVADGHPRPEVDGWGARHIRLAAASADFGDTPRRIASEAAIDSGFDAVIYVDADNWLRPRHVESLLACHLGHGAALCHSARTFHRIGGTLLPLLQQGDNVTHVDTSCLFVAREALDLLPLWGAWPRELSCIGDRMYWQAAVARGWSHAFTGALTTCYEAAHEGFYRAAGEAAPQGSRPDIDLKYLYAWHVGLPDAERAQLDRRCGFPVTALLAPLAPKD